MRLQPVLAAVICGAFVGAVPVGAWASASTPGEVRPSEVMARSDAQLGARGVGMAGALPVRGVTPGTEDRTLAPYFAQVGGDDAVEALPLKATSAEVEVAGVIAHVRLKQTFENTGTKPLEAVYVFPASTRAAVHGMRMRIGERTIEARIEKREQARQDYEAAKANGQRASLLEQQRPNVFTTQVANLMPKDRIEVELEYSELLIPEDATYELVIPTVVGPRYGAGADPRKDQWIANPYLHAGEKPPYTFDVRVDLKTGLALKDVQSPSHPVDIAFGGQDAARVTLKDRDGGNRDFVLRYRLAGKTIDAAVLLGANAKEKFFAVMIEPPARVETAQVVPREYLFVVDVSGSMGGFPLDTAKTLMRGLIGALRPTDHFNVLLFSGVSATWKPKSVAASKGNVEEAIAFVDAARGGGGTELMQALQTAYAIPRVDQGVSRSVVLVTDGYVGVEVQAFKFVREHLGDTNLFAFGIGSSVNRGLIEGLARAGSGEPYVVLGPGKAADEAERFRKAIERPVLTDVRVRFHGFDAYEVAPGALPDVMANRPVVVFGKYRGEAKGTIELTGVAAGASYSKRIPVAEAAKASTTPTLQWLWARKWIELLEDQYALTGAKEVEEAITDLGLSYRLLSHFTSFVAIDNVVVNKGGKTTTVKQPLPMPQGVPNTAVTGSAGVLGSYGFGARGSGAGGGGTGLGLGGLGITGSGRGAGGYGSIDLGGKGAEARPKVSAESASVSGSLDKTAVLKVMRRHRNEIKYCYEQALSKNPGLGGKLTIEFTLDAKGMVKAAKVTHTTLKDATMEACVLARVKRWRFSQPAEGEVTVSFPWAFVPGDAN